MKKMTVRQHILNYIKHLVATNKSMFKTSDIQNLSERSVKFTNSGRLGSPGSYERAFRELRKNGSLNVVKFTGKMYTKQRQASWFIREENQNEQP